MILERQNTQDLYMELHEIDSGVALNMRAIAKAARKRKNEGKGIRRYGGEAKSPAVPYASNNESSNVTAYVSKKRLRRPKLLTTDGTPDNEPMLVAKRELGGTILYEGVSAIGPRLEQAVRVAEVVGRISAAMEVPQPSATSQLEQMPDTAAVS